MATSNQGTRPPEDRTRFFRLSLIIDDELTQILRDLLHNEVHPSLIYKVIQRKYLSKLRPDQVVVIKNANTHGYQEFDITLLYTLLRNVCQNITPPSQGWGVSAMPSPNEVTVGDDIKRIHIIRNTLFGHIPEAAISETDFKEYLSIISDICTRMHALLNKDYAKRLQDAKDCSIDSDTEKKYQEQIKTMAEEEKTIRDMLQNIQGTSKARINVERKRQKTIKQAFAGKKVRLSQLEEQLSSSTSDIKEDIDSLGIDYLRHNLPSDHRTFPMIAEKLEIPQEILYWSLENREKFVRSMKVGNISVFNGRAMVIGCARAGKTTLVKKIKGDKDLETTSTSGIEIHSHAFKLNSDESTIIVSTDEEKEKGCLSLNPGMLDRYDEKTQKTSVGVNVNVVPDQSNVTSPREENHVVDNASNSPSSTEGTFNPNNSASAVYVTPGTGISYATLEQNIDLNNCVPSVNMDNLKMLGLLDFAGHSAYYACHHIFFSPRAIFILVVDMTKDLNSIATEACTKEGLIYSNWTYADYIKYWLGSIHTYSSKVAPVILAFSHSEDNGADPKKALQYFNKICDCLPRKLLDHLDKRRIYSFQKQSDKNVEAFKECLADTVKSQSHWGERVPISWTKLEAVLKKLKESNYIVSFSNLLRLVLDLKINTEEDLLNALIFFNDTGVILFRSEIKDMIILDVQWLVDAFKRIIFDEEHMEAMEMRDFAEFQELNEHGLLSSKVLNVLWQNSDFYQHKHSLVNHMKQLDMLAELSKELWYVPCMNKQKYSWEILNNCNVSSRFCFLFEFLPFIIYHRLVVACINDSNMGMKPWKRSERMCIFHTVTILTYKNDTHRVLIAICDNKERTHRDFPYSIEIQINVTKPREIDTRLTSKLKKEISDKLTVLRRGILSSEFYPHVGYRCRLETFGKNVESHIITEEEMSGSEYDCPKCSQPHIVDVGSIRRFWEKDEPHTPWTDILSDVGLMNVAKQLGAEWTQVVGHLGLKQAEIDQIKLDNPYNTINQITIALQRWRDRQEGQADTILQQLFSALRSCDRTDMLEDIQEKYNITERSRNHASSSDKEKITNLNSSTSY
uniref:Uncharacterized protein LOC111119843 isoform X2 n=1 Tax=Crassostrea virginica TaxID=6565 RepID=A0A8B8CNU8_CRAVI|nr:uncharacterized protein LOC111119843 isoform X2 [Crassostrea virginica]